LWELGDSKGFSPRGAAAEIKLYFAPQPLFKEVPHLPQRRQAARSKAFFGPQSAQAGLRPTEDIKKAIDENQSLV